MENLRDVEGRRFDLRRERRTEKIWGSQSENQITLSRNLDLVAMPLNKFIRINRRHSTCWKRCYILVWGLRRTFKRK
ncbi:hypothetical protein CIPAW_15G050300 [Carya illinoinensis]|uniref:Uncharacterized protein n=1 Tax=Carya illinoinensis TaxID=32201 RepID=A0A8T1NBL9_CARIL|nr:hypothetical protein CIPAW_15G050300 [Carya illinoinensis]